MGTVRSEDIESFNRRGAWSMGTPIKQSSESDTSVSETCIEGEAEQSHEKVIWEMHGYIPCSSRGIPHL